MRVDIALYSMQRRARRIWVPALRHAEYYLDEATNQDEYKAAEREIRRFEEKLGEGYIIDSYTSPFLPSMGLCWDTVASMIENECDLPIKGASELLQLVEAQPITAAKVQGAMTRRSRLTSAELVKLTTDLVKKRSKLIRMLKRSIKTGEMLFCNA